MKTRVRPADHRPQEPLVLRGIRDSYAAARGGPGLRRPGPRGLGQQYRAAPGREADSVRRRLCRGRGGNGRAPILDRSLGMVLAAGLLAVSSSAQFGAVVAHHSRLTYAAGVPLEEAVGGELPGAGLPVPGEEGLLPRLARPELRVEGLEEGGLRLRFGLRAEDRLLQRGEPRS